MEVPEMEIPGRNPGKKMRKIIQVESRKNHGMNSCRNPRNNLTQNYLEKTLEELWEKNTRVTKPMKEILGQTPRFKFLL